MPEDRWIRHSGVIGVRSVQWIGYPSPEAGSGLTHYPEAPA